MGLRYENLDNRTRGFMTQEIEMGNLYESPRLTVAGREAWPRLLAEAARGYSDDWLSAELQRGNYFRHEEEYTRAGVSHLRRINISQAAQQLAEGEFNRYYIRGLCRRALDEGVTTLAVYRGKAVSAPRPESEAKIGTHVAAETLLATLRTSDFVTVEEAAGVPGGPNSGLTCRLP